MSSTLNAVVVLVAVLACLLYTSPTNAQWVTAYSTTCHTGEACSSCTGDRVKTLLLPSGIRTQVCCPGCASRYFSSGTVLVDGSRKAYCQCSFALVTGNVSKGEECSAPGMTSYLPTINGMPVCCADPKVPVSRPRERSQPRSFVYNCEIKGNCWRGSQCASCNQGYVRTMRGGVRVCCPDCEERVPNLGSLYRCNCN